MGVGERKRQVKLSSGLKTWYSAFHWVSPLLCPQFKSKFHVQNWKSSVFICTSINNNIIYSNTKSQNGIFFSSLYCHPVGTLNGPLSLLRPHISNPSSRPQSEWPFHTPVILIHSFSKFKPVNCKFVVATAFFKSSNSYSSPDALLNLEPTFRVLAPCQENWKSQHSIV